MKNYESKTKNPLTISSVTHYGALSFASIVLGSIELAVQSPNTVYSFQETPKGYH